MLLRQLEYLSALARERHFGRPAAACQVSQPALSEAVRRLESELGVQIGRRGRSFEGFTPEGEQAVAWAQRIVAGSAALRGDLSGMLAGPTGPRSACCRRRCRTAGSSTAISPTPASPWCPRSRPTRSPTWSRPTSRPRRCAGRSIGMLLGTFCVMTTVSPRVRRRCTTPADSGGSS